MRDAALDAASIASDASAGSDGAVHDASADAGSDVPVDLPGSIDGVEPESQANHPPMIDARGVLYRVTESTAADGNSPRMMRSSDGGATWLEADASNRPRASDLEGCWQLQFGSTIYLSVANSDRVWFSAFHTSDASDRPDRWSLDEEVETDLGNPGGVVQSTSLARTSDGAFWLFYSGTMIDGRQQIAYRRRSADGTWSDRQRLDDEAGSWTGARLVVGADDVTHVFYKDHLGDRLLWRTLSATGALSAARRIDVGGTSGERIPQTAAVHYDAGGIEVVVVGYADADGRLRTVTVTDGVPAAPETVSSLPVLENPPVALNDGTVAHLAVHATTVHALWVDRESGDVLHSARPHGGAWSSPDVAWSSGPSIAWWVYGNVYVRGGRTRLGLTYDVGEHADDVGRIEYDELTLTP